MKRLGVNIDHIATLRNARGETHPDPCFAASEVIKMGADSVTIHLREDRRHINDLDAKKICKLKKILVNLEISMNDKIVKNALKIKPNYICIVPENRKEVTTEGGLNLDKNQKKLRNIIQIFKQAKIRTSLFVNPSIRDIKISNDLNADCVEIHTGRLSNLVKSKKDYNAELSRIKKSSVLAKKLNIEVHAGHGLDYQTTKILSKINEIQEFNIGHFIIGESIFFGLSKKTSSIKDSKFKKRIYSSKELAQSILSKNKVGYFSKRFAAKEAFAKALGTGFRGNLNFNDIEIINDKMGKPYYLITKKITELIQMRFKIKKFNCFLSISDENDYSTAFTIIQSI